MRTSSSSEFSSASLEMCSLPRFHVPVRAVRVCHSCVGTVTCQEGSELQAQGAPFWQEPQHIPRPLFPGTGTQLSLQLLLSPPEAQGSLSPAGAVLSQPAESLAISVKSLLQVSLKEGNLTRYKELQCYSSLFDLGLISSGRSITHPR